MTERLRAVALVRMSTSAQHASPERQRAAFADYCARWDLEPAGYYEDLATSATHVAAADRPGLQALLADARRRRFEIVFVEELSRAARRSEEFFPLDAELRRLGVALVSKHDEPKQQVSAAQRFARGVMALAAELEAGLLGERVRDALALRVKQGQYRGGNISLGYRWDKEAGTWGVDEGAADLARLVFRTFLQLRNLEATAAVLNQAGHPTGKGNRWSGSSVRALLGAPMYRGYLRFAGTDYPCPGLPEVIPPDLLAQADAHLADRSRRPQRADQSPHSLFTGLLRCPECGAWLTVHVTRRGEYRYVGYYCWRGRLEPRTCSFRRHVGQGPLERALLPMVIAYLRDLASELPAPTRRHQAGHSERTRQRLEGERQRILRLHVTGRIDEEELDAMLEQVRGRMEAAQAADQPPTPTLTRREVQAIARDLERHWRPWTVPAKRGVLQRLVEHIVPDLEDLAGSAITWKL